VESDGLASNSFGGFLVSLGNAVLGWPVRASGKNR
jgi:hypothetical protein